jgi:prevent-host-death family protein
MKSVSAARVAAQFDEYLAASREQPVLVTRNGKPVAVLLAVRNKAQAKQAAEGRCRSLQSIFQEAHLQLQKGGGIPHDQFWAQVEESRRARPSPRSRRKTA